MGVSGDTSINARTPGYSDEASLSLAAQESPAPRLQPQGTIARMIKLVYCLTRRADLSPEFSRYCTTCHGPIGRADSLACAAGAITPRR